MIRALHLSDLHLTDGRRLQDEQRPVLASIVDRGVAAQVDAWFLTGDLTGRSVPHRATPAERLVLYEQLARMCAVAPVLIVPGNHDEARDLAAARHVGASVVGDGCWPVYVLDGAGSRRISTPGGDLLVYWLAYPTKRWLLEGLEVRGLRETQAAVEQRLNEILGLWANDELHRSDEAPAVFLGHLAVTGASLSGAEVMAGQEIAVRPGALQALGVSYGALGHLHLRQEVADRVWYVGSPWRTDYGEREQRKVFHLVDIERRGATVEAVETGCRWLEALDYRWAPAGDDDVPSWTIYPDGASLTRAFGAEVRARLTVPEQHVASCPWPAELARLTALGARHVQAERIVEPVLRVRAPTVASAATLPAKLSAYWTTLGTDVPDADRAVALELLSQLETLSDDEILDASR